MESPESGIMYSLVIPVYKNEASIDSLLHVLRGLYERLERRLEVVFVVDGSPDRSHDKLREGLQGCDFPAELVCLSRNFGSFAAIRMGLSVATGQYFAVMAADLQEPIELVEEFFRSLYSEPVDIVVGVRMARDDPFLSRVSSGFFWGIYRRLVQPEMPVGGIDVFGCNRQVRDVLLTMEEMNSSLVGQIIWLGFRRKSVPYRRRPREFGRSGWGFRRKVRYMFDSILSFTSLPVTLLALVGTLGLAFSVVAGTVIFITWLLGGIPVAGYTPIILTVLIAMFSQLFGLGIIGIYVWRTFENTKRRPSVIPMSRESFSTKERKSVSRKDGLLEP
ncbi:MAG: glycosyltransferase family 2 protein [Thermoguttaceae bacterium]|jgi:glycosyltransferase involved in cell wall biosynthesis